MHRFHGDLLIGGLRLRALEGELDELACGTEEFWSGRFRILSTEQPLLEVGRPYLLMLDDGRAGRVEVTDCQAEMDEDACVVCFQPVGGKPR